MKKALEIAEDLADRSLIERTCYSDKDSVLQQMTGGHGVDEVEMFKNIGRLNNGADEFDPFYIFKVNCQSINGEPSYVFKCSWMAACLAIKMDMDMQEEGTVSSMTEEYAFLNAMHTRVKGFKTLTLWTYHPGVRRIMHLACMEAEKENTESMALFLKLFNDVLREITGNNNYKWKPHGMMCNESGANFQAISKVFGREFLGHTVSCQWHFWQCAKCHVKDINVHEQETFKSLFNEVCYALTANQFEKVSAALGNIYVQNNIGN